MKSKKFENIRPKLSMGTEVEFEEFMDGVAKGIKLKEILTLEEIEEQERLKNIKADGRKGKRLF